MTAGTLTYETKLDTKSFQDGINDVNDKVQSGGTKMKSIIGALGISKLISTAINMITNSLDSAISRLDTMNNFPKVMSNLGISTYESQKAINKLSEGLQGIPTRLDAGALAVQRFTSKNMDINKSTELFLALNNAILAGGASTQLQESAMEQLTQAYSKGKMDMMEWRTLQQAMPAQLKQVADTMGLDVDALGEMMRQGDDTDKVMDKFLDTIIELNKNGGKNIKSFAEQSRNATDGIRTNITNMKTAISRGTANIIDSVNKMLKKVNINGIGDLISKLGKKIETVLKNIAKFIEKLPIEAMMKALKKLVPVIEAVVVAFIAYEATMKAIALINIAKTIISTVSAFISLIPAITSAKDAMTLLNMVMNANPIALVISAVALLATGLYALAQKEKELTEEEKKEIEELEKQTQKVKENKEAWDNLKETKQKNIDSGMTELTHYEALYDELMNITDANGKVKDGYEQRASFIVGQLNDALGLEINMTNGIISNYDYLRDSIQKVIEKKKAKIILDAQEDLYKQALLDQATATSDLADLEDTLNKKKKKQTELNSELQSAQSEYYRIFREEGALAAEMQSLEVQKIQEKVQKQNEAVETAQKNYDTQKNIVEQYAYTIGQYENNMALAHEERYSEMSTVNWNYVKDMDDVEKSKLEQLQKERYDTELHLQTLTELKDKYNTDMYNSQIEADKKQLEEIDNSLKSIQSTTDEGLKKTHLIWRNDLDDQLSSITGKNIEFKNAGDGNVQMYIDGVAQGEPTSKKNMAKLVENTLKEVSKQKTGSKDAGVELINGLNNGVGDQTAQNGVFGTIAGFASRIISTFKSKLKISSPSKVTKEFGKFTIQGFEVGMENEEDKALKQIDDFGDEVLDRMENAVNMETGKMSFNGTAGSVSQILSANAQFEGTIPLRVDLDGEKIYDNQQKITARKTLQYGGARQ